MIVISIIGIIFILGVWMVIFLNDFDFGLGSYVFSGSWLFFGCSWRI